MQNDIAHRQPIRNFLASHYSRRDSESSRLLDVRVSTKPTDTFILSQKTKSSVPPMPCLTGQNRTKRGQGRTGRCRMMTGEAAFLGFSSSDILVDCSRVSAMSICPISQRTFVWLNLSALKKYFKFTMIFLKFSIMSFCVECDKWCQEDVRWCQEGVGRCEEGVKWCQKDVRWCQEDFRWCQEGVRWCQKVPGEYLERLLACPEYILNDSSRAQSNFERLLAVGLYGAYGN